MSRIMCAVLALVVATAVVQAAASEVTQVSENQSEKKTHQLVNPLMMKDPSAMLTELEDMIRSGETPAFDLVSMIKSTIQDAIMPSLEATRNAALGETTEHLDAIQLCNNESHAQADQIKRTTEESVNTARSHHAACRDAQETMYHHNLTNAESYCLKLGKFLHDAKPLSITDGKPRADAVNYVKSVSINSKMCSGSAVTELADNCTETEAELHSKGTECLQKQKYFEEVFCTWKKELELNCQDLASCHSTAVTAYWHHVNKTAMLVDKWNVETAALQKILCYCNVWLSDMDDRDNRSQHNATQFDVCKDQSHLPVPVDYGTPAAKVSCPLTSVTCHPGAQCFNQEYSNFPDFVATVVPCTQGSDLYTAGESGMVDGCPLGYSGIFGRAVCEQAADELGYIMRTGITSDSTGYPGCYFHEPSSTAYFNTHPNPAGTWNTANAGQICMLEATTAVPSTVAPTIQATTTTAEAATKYSPAPYVKPSNK